MEFKYKEEMQKHGLTINDLPEDAITGIDQLNDVAKGLRMLEKSGKKPTAKTLRKIKAMDKWITYEIYDHVNDTDNNSDDMPFEDEIIDDLKSEISENGNVKSIEAPVDSLPLKVEAELKSMHDAGINSIDIDDLQTKSPKCYQILFESYDPDEENGIETSLYSIIESKSDDKFIIKKK